MKRLGLLVLAVLIIPIAFFSLGCGDFCCGNDYRSEGEVQAERDVNHQVRLALVAMSRINLVLHPLSIRQERAEIIPPEEKQNIIDRVDALAIALQGIAENATAIGQREVASNSRGLSSSLTNFVRAWIERDNYTEAAEIIDSLKTERNYLELWKWSH